MRQFNGKSVFGGTAIGNLYLYRRNEQRVTRCRIEDPKMETRRFFEARDRSVEQLRRLYGKAKKDVGEKNAAVFEVHQMMLEDEVYLDFVTDSIRSQKVNAEYAVAVAGDHFSTLFAAMDDEYMKARAADVKDISERVISNLLGSSGSYIQFDEPVIVLADDLTPSETVRMDKEKVLAFVTVHGSVHSHTAILACTMGIPALIGTEMELSQDFNGKLAIVDGDRGVLYVDPDETTLGRMQKIREDEEEHKKLLLGFKNKESVTLDQKKLPVCANIGNLKELALALQNGAEGIGLFRSEFLYLESGTYPTEKEQFNIYKTAAEAMAGKRVAIRTLDIGADKQCGYFGLDQEENPALGFRAIRICLARTEIFKTQLRALFRASAFGKIAIMYPMITSLKEVKRIQEIVAEVRQDLAKKGIPFGEVEQGIMIETPAAAVISDDLAREVDFFSIGTNDLTQYLLAIDRQNPKLDDFYDAHHPAVLRTIQTVVDNAHKAGIWCGICGELGADMDLTEWFVKLGVDELSVSPGRILPIRKLIRGMDTGIYGQKNSGK